MKQTSKNPHLNEHRTSTMEYTNPAHILQYALGGTGSSYMFTHIHLSIDAMYSLHTALFMCDVPLQTSPHHERRQQHLSFPALRTRREQYPTGIMLRDGISPSRSHTHIVHKRLCTFKSRLVPPCHTVTGPPPRS